MENDFNLSQLKKGDNATITHINSGSLPAKFLEMGLLPGAEFILKHKAPFNGPLCIQIKSNNTLLAIRTAEAAHILVER